MEHHECTSSPDGTWKCPSYPRQQIDPVANSSGTLTRGHIRRRHGRFNHAKLLSAQKLGWCELESRSDEALVPHDRKIGAWPPSRFRSDREKLYISHRKPLVPASALDTTVRIDQTILSVEEKTPGVYIYPVARRPGSYNRCKSPITPMLMPMPSTGPSHLSSKRMGHSRTPSASQVPLPASIIPIPSHSPSRIGSRKVGQSIVPRSIVAASPSQMPLPASVAPNASITNPASRVPGTLIPGTSKIFGYRRPGQGLTVIPEGFPSVTSPPQTEDHGAGTTPTLYQARGGLPLAESLQSQALDTSTIGKSTIRTPGGRATTSMYTNPVDVERAQKQLSYASLTAGERTEQDTWAGEKGKDLAPCPNNLGWKRHHSYPGYHCSGGVSDLLPPSFT